MSVSANTVIRSQCFDLAFSNWKSPLWDQHSALSCAALRDKPFQICQTHSQMFLISPCLKSLLTASRSEGCWEPRQKAFFRERRAAAKSPRWSNIWTDIHRSKIIKGDRKPQTTQVKTSTWWWYCCLESITLPILWKHSLSLNLSFILRAHSFDCSKQRMARECCPLRKWMLPRLKLARYRSSRRLFFLEEQRSDVHKIVLEQQWQWSLSFLWINSTLNFHPFSVEIQIIKTNIVYVTKQS